MKVTFVLLFTLFSHTALSRGPGKGPVISECQEEIKKHCSDKKHGQGEVRECLVKNIANVSEKCKNALDNTGKGRGINY